MRDLVVVAPVLPTRETALRNYLRELPGSPLARLPLATHFARWVVVPVDGPQLLFSSSFDGDPGRYIDALARLGEAGEIWSHCRSDEDLRDPARLRDFLTAHRLKSPYILSAWPKATVAEINHALQRRDALSRFAKEAEGLDPAALAHSFRELFAR